MDNRDLIDLNIEISAKDATPEEIQQMVDQLFSDLQKMDVELDLVIKGSNKVIKLNYTRPLGTESTKLVSDETILDKSNIDNTMTVGLLRIVSLYASRREIEDLLNVWAGRVISKDNGIHIKYLHQAEEMPRPPETPLSGNSTTDAPPPSPKKD